MRSLISSLAILLMVGTANICAQEDAGQDTTKDTTKDVTKDVAKKLAGTWVGDADKTEDLHGDEAEDGMLEQIASVTFIFSKEGGMQMKSDNFEVKADFKATKSEDEDGLYDFTFSGGDAPSPMTGTLKFADDNTIHMSPGGRPAGVFVRKKEATEEKKEMKEESSDKKAMSADDAKAKLVGTWVGDGEATAKIAEEMELEQSMIDMITESVAQLKLQLNVDGTYTMDQGPRGEDEGTWAMEEGDEKGTFKLVAETQEGELTFAVNFLDNGSVKMQPSPDEPPVVFKKSDE